MDALNGHRRGATSGDLLRRTRERARLSQRAVASFLGVRPQRIANLEHEASPTQDAASRVLWAIAELVRDRDGLTTPGRDRPEGSPDGGRVAPGPADHRPEDAG